MFNFLRSTNYFTKSYEVSSKFSKNEKFFFQNQQVINKRVSLWDQKIELFHVTCPKPSFKDEWAYKVRRLRNVNLKESYTKGYKFRRTFWDKFKIPTEEQYYERKTQKSSSRRMRVVKRELPFWMLPNKPESPEETEDGMNSWMDKVIQSEESSYVDTKSQVQIEIGPCVGIDLGATNSFVSFFEKDSARIIENAEGMRLTPSIVAYTEDEQVLVGVSAKRQISTNFANTIFGVKRIIGRSFDDPIVQSLIKKVGFQMIKSKDGKVALKIKDKEVSVTEVTSHILKRLRDSTEAHLGTLANAVSLSISIDTNENQKKELELACELAGFKLESFVLEPIAAVLGFGFGFKPEPVKKYFLVYDFGGTAFTASLLSLENDDFEVISSKSDQFLGGDDIDEVIVNFILTEFKRTNKVDLSQNILAMSRIREMAEKVKVELTNSTTAEINLPFIGIGPKGPMHINLKLSRSKLEYLADSKIKQTMKYVEDLFTESKIPKESISDLVVSGGMARMPKIQLLLGEYFPGIKISQLVNPEESISLGCSIFSEIAARKERLRRSLQVLLSISIGIEIMNGEFLRVIKRNTPLPAEVVTRVSKSVIDQTAVYIKVYQGEREWVHGNKPLGCILIEDVVNDFIKLKFSMDKSGLLTIVPLIERGKKVILRAQSFLPEKELNAILTEAETNKQSDLEVREKTGKLRDEVETLIYNIERFMNEDPLYFSYPEEEAIEKEIDNLIATTGNYLQEDIIRAAMEPLETILALKLEEVSKKQKSQNV